MEESMSQEKRTLHPLAWMAIGAGAVAAAVAVRQGAIPSSNSKRLMGQVRGGVHNVRDIGEKWVREGGRAAHDLRQDARTIAAGFHPGSDHTERHDQRRDEGGRHSTSQHESAMAAFMATLLAKGVASYFQWRSTERAREQAARRQQLMHPSESDLEEMTVAELRRKASAQEIDGRSNMNKEELVSALKH